MQINVALTFEHVKNNFKIGKESGVSAVLIIFYFLHVLMGGLPVFLVSASGLFRAGVSCAVLDPQLFWFF